jgi:hypothetical protein
MIDRFFHNAHTVSHGLLHRLTKTVLVSLCQAHVTKKIDNYRGESYSSPECSDRQTTIMRSVNWALITVLRQT